MKYTFSESTQTYAGIELTLQALKKAVEAKNTITVDLLYSSIVFTTGIILDCIEKGNEEMSEEEWKILKQDFEYFEGEAFKIYSAYKMKVA